MQLHSYRKYALVLLAAAALGMLLWYRGEGLQESSLGTAFGLNATVTAAANANADKKGRSQLIVLADPRSASSPSGQGLRPIGGADSMSLGLFNENARSLARAGRLAKYDYALIKGPSDCLSFLQAGGDGPKALKEYGPAMPLRERGGNIGIGPATEAMRLAAFQRSFEKCSKLYEGGRFTEEEMTEFRALPTALEYRSVGDTLRYAKDFNNPETMAALSKAVTEPMFGRLALLLADKVDYRDMVAEYGPEKVMPLYALTVPLVLCRMGDDCGPGGIVAEQLCWLNRICGDPVEEAIWSTLRAQGVDTRVMEQFISRVHLGLQNRDPTIFKKPSK